MLQWKEFRDAVAQVVITMDVIESCRLGSLLDAMGQRREQSWDVLEKMQKAGLLAIEEAHLVRSYASPSLVSITGKGRLLAQDIRALAGKAVRV